MKRIAISSRQPSFLLYVICPANAS